MSLPWQLLGAHGPLLHLMKLDFLTRFLDTSNFKIPFLYCLNLQVPDSVSCPKIKVVEIDFQYPAEGILERQKQGYRITSVAANSDQIAFVFSITGEAPASVKQETLLTSHFPVSGTQVINSAIFNTINLVALTLLHGAPILFCRRCGRGITIFLPCAIVEPYLKIPSILRALLVLSWVTCVINRAASVIFFPLLLGGEIRQVTGHWTWIKHVSNCMRE